MASYSNRWAPRRTSKPPRHLFGSGRTMGALALAGLGALIVWKLAAKKPTAPVLPPPPSSGVLPLGSSS